MRHPPLSAMICLGLLMGCAERDNPFDPVNRSSVTHEPKIPVPSDGNIVVDPDRPRGEGYYGNVNTAFKDLSSGDTLWIKGGHSYKSTDLLRIDAAGTAGKWTVIRSWGGGEARISPVSRGVNSGIRIQAPYVRLSGVAVVGFDGIGLIVNGVPGPVQVDSSRFDSCGSQGMDIRLRSGSIRLKDIQLRGNTLSPQFNIDVLPLNAIDSSRIVQSR